MLITYAEHASSNFATGIFASASGYVLGLAAERTCP